MGEGEQALSMEQLQIALASLKVTLKSISLVSPKIMYCLMCKVNPESYSRKFGLKSTYLLALRKRNLHTAASTVGFFGLASKTSVFLSFLPDLLPASPEMKSKPKIC